MNKFKKFGLGAVAVVMSCSMVFSLAACGGGEDTVDPNEPLPTESDYTEATSAGYLTTTSEGATRVVSLMNGTYGMATRLLNNQGGWETAASYWNYLKTSVDDEVSANAGANNYTSDTEIGIAIGYSSATTGAFYSSLDASVALPGGYTAVANGIKPAIYAIQEALDVQFANYYGGKSTSANLESLITNNTWGSTVDICTSDISEAVSYANSNRNILNLASYLDRMPNFKAFLEENPVVYLSLLQDGMSTSDGTGKTIYIAPYFDGNDDIERYCLIRQDWVEDLLDDTLTYDGDTYYAACASDTHVSGGWMGLTGSYEIETSTEADAGATTFTLKKDYDAAKVAAADETTALGAAYKDITGTAYTGSNGNIVDIMNMAINANLQVTGKQLATLYRAYIDVAYTNKETGASAYGETRSNLFNGYSAAWDVDDLVAMLRIVKTNSQNVGLDSLSTEGIFPRENNNDRTPDIIRLCAQLYGERGADSRYEYTYIDSDGELQDMRENASFYQALENFGALASEGLVYSYIDSSGSLDTVSGTTLKGDCKNNAGVGFMEYDYSQTQTTQMYDKSSSSVDSDYLFAAINTPVSKWDVNGDGTKETTMRFTESWRSTKTGGLCVAASVANDENLLSAVLAFIDYLYSNDGQILSTYGIQSTNGNTNPNGTWYGNEVTSVAIDTVAEKVGGQYVVKEEYESQYFCFNDTLYTGTLYKGKMTPIVTTELYNSFLSTSGAVYDTFAARGSFTSFARSVLGATLPMGVKDQSFENQLTATEAAAEATKVSASLSNGTIKHVTLEVDSTNYWYTTVPTGLPLSTTEQNNIDASTQSSLKYITGTKAGDSKAFYSIFHYIIFFGYSGTYNQQGVSVVLSASATYLPW